MLLFWMKKTTVFPPCAVSAWSFRHVFPAKKLRVDCTSLVLAFSCYAFSLRFANVTLAAINARNVINGKKLVIPWFFTKY